jgi:hypothetical protein
MGDLSSTITPPASRGLTRQGNIHLLLATGSPLKIEQIYRLVFEKILGETISTSPVVIAESPSRR